MHECIFVTLKIMGYGGIFIHDQGKLCLNRRDFGHRTGLWLRKDAYDMRRHLHPPLTTSVTIE